MTSQGPTRLQSLQRSIFAIGFGPQRRGILGRIARWDGPVRQLNHIGEQGDKQDRSWASNGTITTILEQTRAQGYCMRERDYWAGPVDFGPEVNAIASINLFWIRGVLPLEDLVESHLAALLNVAEQIGQSYSSVIGD